MNPNFMKTLYEWSSKQSSGMSDIKPMDVDKQKWLQQALENMFTDGATIIKTCFEALPDLEEEAQIDIWVNLQEMFENIDNALVLKPLGKWPVIIEAMKGQNEVHTYVQKAAASALQNCPDAVQAAIDSGIASAIQIEKSCIGVISSLIKDNVGVLCLEEQILLKFKGLGCDDRVDFLNDQLISLTQDEEIPLESRKAFANQVIKQ